MNCKACGWQMLPPRCQNPDCKRGNKLARPHFRPPLRTQRGHGANGRVRNYRGSDSATIEDPAEQAATHLYDKRLGIN